MFGYLAPPVPYGGASPYGPPMPPMLDMNFIVHDPQAFEAYFMDQLQTLTFNCKDIISYLTDLSIRNAGHMSSVVGQTLDMHISHVRASLSC